MSLGEILHISFEFSPKVGTRQLPHLDKRYQSNIKGLYIVGDLADAPVIKISLNQGFDVVTRMFGEDFGGKVPAKQDGVVDVAVVGAGPGGIGAALACKKNGLSYELIERERPFNTIQNYPKHKHVFSEPREFKNNSRFPFVDRLKEDLVTEWESALDEHQLVIRQPEEVVDIKKTGDVFEVQTVVGKGERSGPEAKPGSKLVIKARRVVLAIGRRGAVNKIGCKGEDNPRVAYALADPDKHKGEKCLVVGGGDSAVEAAVALAQAGADVSISYRQDSFIRAKALNNERITKLINEGKVKALLKTSVKEITDQKVTLKGEAGDVELENVDRVFALIGTTLPIPFLKKIGVMMEGAFTWQRTVWIVSFALMTYLFYCLKAHRAFFPFGPHDFLGGVPEALKLPVGTFKDGSPRVLDGGFWGTVIYSLMITGFGVQAMRKYKSPIQTRRYLLLIIFQLIFLFGIPEIIAPFIIDKPWYMYSLSVPWPLSIWSLYRPEHGWFIFSAAVAFIGMPLFVRYHGERFCSWACGCGGLAETLGDRWRHLAPRGKTAIKFEWLGKIVLVFAGVTTFVILGVDIFHFFEYQAWGSTKQFLQDWYGLMVDFWMACVIGVAFYPYLGNRVWCRFMCPLRAYMELLSRWFGRLKIVANDKCIGCSECTRYCQMGIPVQKFAQMREDFGNHNSACIQCGICVEVCPMDVLSVVRAPIGTRIEAKTRKSLPIVIH
jgi:NosR/NirI family transcriptional regulator, nitrous oxide reductase regulator